MALEKGLSHYMKSIREAFLFSTVLLVYFIVKGLLLRPQMRHCCNIKAQLKQCNEMHDQNIR